MIINRRLYAILKLKLLNVFRVAFYLKNQIKQLSIRYFSIKIEGHPTVMSLECVCVFTCGCVGGLGNFTQSHSAAAHNVGVKGSWC